MPAKASRSGSAIRSGTAAGNSWLCVTGALAMSGMLALLSFFALSGPFCGFARPTVVPGAGPFRITNTVRCGRGIGRPRGCSRASRSDIANLQSVQMQPGRLAQKPPLDRRIPLQDQQVLPPIGGGVPALGRCEHLVRRHVGQLDVGGAVRQRVIGRRPRSAAPLADGRIANGSVVTMTNTVERRAQPSPRSRPTERRHEDSALCGTDGRWH